MKVSDSLYRRGFRVADCSFGVAKFVLGIFLLLVPLLAPVPAEAIHEDQLGLEVVQTLAGTGQEGYDGDGVPATEAQVNEPTNAAVDSQGNVYFSDTDNHRVRRVAPDGTITTVAGTGERGFNGDDQPATDAKLFFPRGLEIDADDDLYIADSVNSRVRKVDTSTGMITTVAGTGDLGYGGDSGPAIEATFFGVYDVELANDGGFYIADYINNRVRRVNSEGIIETVAGTGSGGFGGDGGAASDAQLNHPYAVSAAGDGSYYIADQDNNRIRKVDTEGVITTVAGNGNLDFDGDGGPATEAELARPTDVALDGHGNIYIADENNSRVRRVDPSGTISTVAGGGDTTDGFDEGISPTEANLSGAEGVTVDEDFGMIIGSNRRMLQLTGVPDLAAVSLNLPSNPHVGEELTYTATATNSGLAGAATGTQLNVSLQHTDVVSTEPSKGTCSTSGGDVSCQLGELGEGETATVDITGTPTAPEIVDHTASVTVNEEDPYPGNNSTSVKSLVADAGCGKQVTEDFTLTEDIGPCPGNGLEVAADGVTIDMNGHSLVGWRGYEGFAYDEFRAGADKPEHPALAALNTGREVGVALVGRHNVTVEGGGTVTGFAAGVMLGGSDGNTIQNLTVTENDGLKPRDAILGDGIVLFHSADNVIADNDVVRNGSYDGIGIWGPGSDNNEITGNLVADGRALRGTSRVWGIIVNGASATGDGTKITGTVIANNTVRGNGSHGISNVNSFDARVVNNLVEKNGLGPEGLARGIAVSTGRELDEADTGVMISGNTVRNNGRHGIQANARGVRIVNNTSTDNGQKSTDNTQYFDLHDATSETCEYNVWNNNRWGSAGYFPECTSKRGLGKGKNPAANASPQQTEQTEPPVRQPPDFANAGG